MRAADRIVGNMGRIPGYHGTLPAEVVDEILERFEGTVFCNGYLRKMVFTPITEKHFSFKTEPVL